MRESVGVRVIRLAMISAGGNAAAAAGSSASSRARLRLTYHGGIRNSGVVRT